MNRKYKGEEKVKKSIIKAEDLLEITYKLKKKVKAILEMLEMQHIIINELLKSKKNKMS